MRSGRCGGVTGLSRAAACLVLACVIGQGSACAQETSPALRDRVGQLCARLASKEPADRDAAEAALIELGPEIVSLLSVSEDQDADLNARLERIRETLQASGSSALNLGASLVTIRGPGIRLSEALTQLQRQSGNVVTDLREQYAQEATNPALKLDLAEVPFFEALDAICDQAGLIPYFYTGDGTIGLLETTRDPQVQRAGMAGQPMRLVSYSGPFRIQLQEIVSRRDFANGVYGSNALFQVAWEPRLRPMLLKLASSDVQILDDRDQSVPPALADEDSEVALRTDNPVAELNLNMAGPSRKAQELDRVTVVATIQVPGGVRAFRFADLSKPGTERVDKATVELVSTQVEDFVWKVRLLLRLEGEPTGLDSYQMSLYSSRIWLQRPDGSRFEHNGGFSSLGATGSQIGFEYLFVDVPGKPGDYSLLYETPSQIESVPLRFEFRAIPLP